MECEMCGKNAEVVAIVEGTQMTVCASCGAFGKVLRQLAPVRREPERKAPRPKEPELVEAIHPDFAKIIRAQRERTGLTQEQFAHRFNIRTSVYQHYETGKATPDIATARKLEHELRISLVVKLKFEGSAPAEHERKGFTLGDMIRKR